MLHRLAFTSVLSLTLAASSFSANSSLFAQRVIVPGTGTKIINVGDDFEEENWTYNFAGPKSSDNIDKKRRGPFGRAANGRWYEGGKRGDPDVVKQVPTPAGGLSGSKKALLLRSMKTGVPGKVTNKMQQDDFICNIHEKIGRTPIRMEPNCVVRVFLPPIDEWENRTGPHFAFRIALEATIRKPNTGFLKIGSSKTTETYWPGMFIELDSKHDGKRDHDYVWIRIRGDKRGRDFKGMQITQTGWWTLGMSVSKDGYTHFFAKPGVADLTASDRITTQIPYSYTPETFRTFFFNVCNNDDGKTWSTKWVIDDPAFYRAKSNSASESK